MVRRDDQLQSPGERTGNLRKRFSVTGLALDSLLVGYDFFEHLPGIFGTVAVNQPRSESWEGAFVSKPVGGYGYSGWIWETVNDAFILKQGAKLLSIETSTPA